VNIHYVVDAVQFSFVTYYNNGRFTAVGTGGTIN